jgi:hypothetical protein
MGLRCSSVDMGREGGGVEGLDLLAKYTRAGLLSPAHDTPAVATAVTAVSAVCCHMCTLRLLRSHCHFC